MRRVAAVTAAILSLAGGAHAGELAGVVYDPSDGTLLAGATVVVTSPSLAGTQAAITDDKGGYRFEGLPLGRYTVTAYYADATVERPDVLVHEAGYTPLHLPVSPPEPIGCVFWSRAPIIDSGSAELGRIVDGDDLLRLPRLRARYPTTGDLRVDGVPWPAGAPPPPDALVDEIQLRLAGLPASRGGTGPATDLALRSGSNQHHGTLQTRRSPSLSASAARLAGPIAEDHVWYAAAAATDSTSLTGLARIDVALAPEHQGRTFLYVDRFSAAAPAVAPSPAPVLLSPSPTTSPATLLAVGSTWRSRFDDHRTELELAGSFTRLALSPSTTTSRSSAAATLTRRQRLLGHHHIKAGLELTRDHATQAVHPAAWLDDAWSVRPNLTLQAGLRHDRDLLPHAALAYDWTLEGRSRAFLSYAGSAERGLLGGVEYELVEDLALLAAARHDAASHALVAGARRRGDRSNLAAHWELDRATETGDFTQRLAVDAAWRLDLCFARNLLAGVHLARAIRGAPPASDAAGLQLGKRFTPTRELSIDVAADLVATATSRTAFITIAIDR